ncbi:RNA polymerase I specific transcription initiation factor RRN3 [Dictyocaulus viviparus]|uniref:RNA polymerase I specific transcription initiation factor RRN3 n=1 Tax=Dictyocaulus viviparus TaxID=29172 RepID=A0A0D8XVL0_DICVI|nr:RNA polymerase I specific transcription initiation factor RRN3 [Dictyocaulus viviparus]
MNTSNAEAAKVQKREEVVGKSESNIKSVITGREILLQYLKGDAIAIMTYRKICNAFEIFPRWEAAAKIQFLEQFLNISSILDERCTDLVTNLSICHVELVFGAAVNNFIPSVKEDGDGGVVLALSTEEQEKFYGMAHRIISNILKSFPMSNKFLLKVLRSGVPHLSRSCHYLIGYLRNLINCLEYAHNLRADIWEIIIDQMVLCDNMLTAEELKDGKSFETDGFIFHMDENEESIMHQDNQMMTRLDSMIRDVLFYISLKHNSQPVVSNDATWLRIGSHSSCDEIFSILLSILENRMLLSVRVRYTSFIWLYLCGLSEKYATDTLESLWSFIIQPPIAQADMAKAHGAAAYMAAFLARAKYLDIGVAFSWMSRIVEWCIQYIDKCGVVCKQITPGVIRHGTFYALCQALFIVFSFRYKEMTRNGAVVTVLFFRSLQLVYCSHILPFDAGKKLPFEPMFPFDSYNLESSAVLVGPLLRRFSPLAEDQSVVSSALKSSQLNDLKEETMDYLEDDDLLVDGSFCDRSQVMTHLEKQPRLLTIYSSSPGLKHFNNLMDMR